MSRSRFKQVLSLEKATEALARAGELDRQITEVDTKLARRTARLKELAAKKAGVLEEELDQLKKQLYEFYLANQQLLEGDKRTLTLASGALTMRLGNWTVHLAQEVEEDPEKRLPEQFRRVTVTANREAMLAAPELAILVDGVTIDRTDRLHLLPAGVTTGIAGPSRKIRFDPKEVAA